MANMLKGVERPRMKSIQYHIYYTLKQNKRAQCYCPKTPSNSQLDHQKPYSQQYTLAQIHTARAPKKIKKNQKNQGTLGLLNFKAPASKTT